MSQKLSSSLLHLRGPTSVHIDWANVYGWSQSLKREIDPQYIFQYLKTYSEVKVIHFYYGQDQHPKSIIFLNRIHEIGFTLHTKIVKYVTVSTQPLIKKRKCDFDLEIAMQVMFDVEKFQSFIFFSGDGDFAPLYKFLIQKEKQVVVISTRNHTGKEVWQLKGKIYLLLLDRKNSLRLWRR